MQNAIVITDGPNLETMPGWFVQRGKNINDVDVTDFIAQESTVGGPLEEYIVAPPYGGALATLPRAIPIVDGAPLPYLELAYQYKLTAAALRFMRNLESDVIGVWPGAPNATLPGPKNKANGSFQQALYRGGMCQFSGSNPWTDTGFAPGVPDAETWNQVVQRYFIDWVNETISPVYVFAMGQTCTTFPVIMSAMPFQLSNWTRGLVAGGGPLQGVAMIQFQLDNNGIPSAFEVSFEAVGLRWSSRPFAPTPFGLPS